jgi:GNAT superfamily N-acetyltransferase
LSFQIIASQDFSGDTLSSITKPLVEYNQQNAPPPNFLQLALCLKDDTGRTVGGLWGRAVYDWLFVDYLVVPEEARGTGIGTELMQRAEAFARENNCVGVWLDTFSFQALPFYEKLGYHRFGQIDDHPRGHVRYFLQKRLSQD